MSRAGEWVRTACITTLGSGYAPFASGTWGSLVAVALFLPLWWTVAGLHGTRNAVEIGLLIGILLSSCAAVAWGPWAIRKYQRKDPKQFTLDEFAGQWVSLLAMPITLSADVWTVVCIVGGQFFLFRVADVIKPPPARQLESLPAGWGVLCDDLMAGVYANIAGQMLWRLTPAATWLGVSLTAAGSGS